VTGTRGGARRRGLAGVALALLAAAHAAADPVPLWEFGLGGGLVAFQDYPGSTTTHVYPVPLAYLVYRGSFLRSDRDGMRGLLAEDSRVELSISAGASAPVRNDAAREGMPELRPTLELGPEARFHLWRSDDRRVRLDLRVPARRVITVEASPHALGWFAAPNLNLDLRDLGGHAGWDLGLSAGPVYADRGYNSYYYSVAPEFANAARPAYLADGGYSGFASTIALSKRWPRYWCASYVHRDSLGGAVFDASPLVHRQSYWSGGFGCAWIIGASTRMVGRSDVR